MERFASQAASIFQAADAVFQRGEHPTPITLLFDTHGSMRLICNSDWPLDRICQEHGASMAYQVAPDKEVLRLEGQCGERRIIYETGRKSEKIRRLLANHAEYALMDDYMVDS